MPTLHILLLLAPLQLGADDPVDYSRQVKPLLAGRCYACHGALKQEAGLRLDTAAAIRTGGETGAAVVVGQSGASLLIERVTDADPESRMPPENEGSPLTAEEVALLRNWIDAGATGPADEKPESDPRQHWSFRPPVRPAVPEVKNTAWVRNPIDSFIGAEHDRHGLTPKESADKRLLLRRVTIDLTGLPPTQAELEAFVADQSPDAYEKVVDRLLASPQYGERWGRHWMDIWRYSDWWGLGAEVRNSQKHIWHWRDWIVESLNADLGYDEMLRQMLAADELYPNDLAKLRASGFMARHYFKFNRTTWLDETVEHTSKAFLGLTFNCCKCHDHKYDPLRQEDYYRLRAFFEPYQIRTDQIAGEADYEKDGIPRGFDCHLDAPTYLFVRGDEKRPRKEQPLTPGLPKLLEFDELKVEPVSLPLEAYQPGLRPWVLENYLAAADRQVSTARTALETARTKLAEAERAQPPVATTPAPTPESPAPASAAMGKSVARDDFSAARPELWEQVAGKWSYSGGKLIQAKDGDERAVLRLNLDPPTNFTVRVRFAITGGQNWKSVGVTFDAAGENEMLAYLSAYGGGPKVQLAYKQGAAYAYPPDGAQARPIKVDETHELVLRVRGQIVNVAVDGEHALAWRSPLPRKPGKVELITYDAQAAFSLFELSELADTEKLVEPSPPAASPSQPATKPLSVPEAKLAMALAERVLANSEAQPAALRARAAADRARLMPAAAINTAELARAAARAERTALAAKAAEDVARAEMEVAQADMAKKPAAEQNLTNARAALEKATKAIDEPSETYAPLKGAVKMVESPTETAESLNRDFPATSTGRRTALARWISDRRHPLTARVAVNHMWGRHFSTPLVPTVFDMGRKGTAPTHPELLDWLAVELMDHNWSMRHIHRLIVTSNTYRMSSTSAGAAENLTRDRENRYYWRMNPGRMEAQVVRDGLLHLSGELDLAMGGPSIPSGGEEASRRRSLYFVHSHNEHHRFLSMFDDAGVQECYRREQSIVPQQALALSNSKQALSAAGKIAEKLTTSGANNADADFIRAGFLVVLASVPTPEELAACEEALAAWSKSGAAAGPEAAQRAARANLINALINHNDFVTIR